VLVSGTHGKEIKVADAFCILFLEMNVLPIEERQISI
jgi:hypothetical protein